MAKGVISKIIKEVKHSKGIIRYVLLEDGTYASTLEDVKIGETVIVFHHEQWDMIKVKKIEGKGDGSKGLKKES